MHTAVRIVTEDGREAEVGETGELWCKGPNITPGYGTGQKQQKNHLKMVGKTVMPHAETRMVSITSSIAGKTCTSPAARTFAAEVEASSSNSTEIVKFRS